MGVFLSASGVLSPDGKAVCEALTAYAAATGGLFDLRAGTMEDAHIGAMQSTATGTIILHPDGFMDWDGLSRHLSKTLSVPVFSFHIHDSDLWMFTAFDKGAEVAWFNPVPDYWEEVSDAEQRKWAGDAGAVAALMPGVTAASIERYLVRWSSEAVHPGQLAYEDDEHPIGSEWQMTDFMRRIGLVYPMDQDGQVTGQTFYLGRKRHQPPSPSSRPGTAKPWWRFW